MRQATPAEVNRRLAEILTARAHGEEQLEEQLVNELLADDGLLVGAFGSLLVSLEAFLDALAERRGSTRIQMIQEIAKGKALDEWA